MPIGYKNPSKYTYEQTVEITQIFHQNEKHYPCAKCDLIFDFLKKHFQGPPDKVSRGYF